MNIIEQILSKIKNNSIVTINSLPEQELLIQDENKITLIEHLLKKNVSIIGISKLINKYPEILLIYLKNNIQIYEKVDEETLFKTINNKKIIEYILEQKTVEINLLKSVETKTEILDYLLKAQKEYLIMFLDEQLLQNVANNITTTYKKYLNADKIMENIVPLIQKPEIILYLLNQYDDKYISLLSTEQLLKKLPNNKKTIEYIIEHNYKIELINIVDIEIVKILYKNNKLDQIGQDVDIEILFEPINERYTYFDYILDKNLNNKMKLLNFSIPFNIETQVKYYVAFAKRNIIEYATPLTEDDLVNEVLDNEGNNTTLLEQLLNTDKDLTINRILTSKLKSNPKIATILKSKGITQSKITLKTNENVFENYIKNQIEQEKIQLGIGPLKEEGEILLNKLEQLFLNDKKSDKKIIESLISGYRRALLVNYELNLQELKKLIEIKEKNYQKFCYYKIDEDAYFDQKSGSVYIDIPTIITVFHETGHALHYYLNNFNQPENIEEIKEKSKQNIEVSYWTQKIYYYIKKRKANLKKEIRKKYKKSFNTFYTKEKIEKIKKTLEKSKQEKINEYKNLGIPEEQLEIILQEVFSVENYINSHWQIIQKQQCQLMLEKSNEKCTLISDILDAIYNGLLYSTEKIPGHGFEYYKDGTNSFEEIIANYSVLVKIGQEESLKEIIGQEPFDEINNYYYQNILGLNIRRQNGKIR